MPTKEAIPEETERKRINLCNPKDVVDKRARCRTTTRTEKSPLLCTMEDLVHREEVRGVTQVLDVRELFLDTLNILRLLV
jgi:hypothetical protein